MAEPAGVQADLRQLLTEIRRVRFGSGIGCPHCSAQLVQPWGSFAGRRRYRCRKCRRTFSDLTHTAAAYCKRLHLWPRYLVAMESSTTIRRSAAQLGVHPSTTFRWRHRILSGIESSDGRELTGFVELDEARFRYSEKGQRRLARPARTRGYWFRDLRLVSARQICAVVACDRLGTAISAVLSTSRPYDHDLRDYIMPRVRRPATILARARPISAYGRVARRNGHDYIEVPRFAHLPHPFNKSGPARLSDAEPSHRVNRVLACIEEIRKWLRPFCGVATRYLQHYLIWQQSLFGRVSWAETARMGIAWPMPARDTRFQIQSRTLNHAVSERAASLNQNAIRSNGI